MSSAVSFLPEVKKALAGGRPEEALLLLRASASPADDFSLQSQYARLAKALAEAWPHRPPWRVAFLAGSPLDIEEWDSLAQVNLMAAVEKSFGVRFLADDLVAIDSVAALLTVLKAREAN